MKNLLVVLALVVLAGINAFGQDAATIAGRKPAAKPTDDTFAREKFDPKRDPKLDLAAAVAAASKSRKRIVLDVGGEWCGWCVYMDRFFVQNAELGRFRDENFVWVKVNFSEENENPLFLAAYPAATGYPHLYVLDEIGKLLQSQDTSPLEAGKGYDLAKFTEFLKTWAPKKNIVE